MIFYILYNIQILSPDGFKNFGLNLPIRKTGKPGRNLKTGRTEFFDVSRQMASQTNNVINKIYTEADIVGRQIIALG